MFLVCENIGRGKYLLQVNTLCNSNFKVRGSFEGEARGVAGRQAPAEICHRAGRDREWTGIPQAVELLLFEQGKWI